MSPARRYVSKVVYAQRQVEVAVEVVTYLDIHQTHNIMAVGYSLLMDLSRQFRMLQLATILPNMAVEFTHKTQRYCAMFAS